MIIDTALEKKEKECRPIRVGVIGAGFMGRGVALQLLASPIGMRLAAISNRTIARAQQVLCDGGVSDFRTVDTTSQLEESIWRGEYCATEDPLLLCDAGNIDVILDATSDIEHGARFVLRALEHGKHVILLNATLDATIGPILKSCADRNNVVITYADGDEPGVAMNLFRFVKTIGYRPVAAGNLKGMLDPYRTPETQRAFAECVGQSAPMITSFSDGTKLSMECTILANATGLKVGRRGMYGPKCAHVRDALNLLPEEQLLNGGLVDFLLGAEPHTGAFVIGHNDKPINKEYMNYFKMGNGPFYVFYTPYHLPHLQVLTTIARAALFHDATVTPLGKPICQVLTVAKRDLRAGDILDGCGGFPCYGMIDNSEVVENEDLLPIGLSEGCRLKHNIPKDRPITNDDVVVPTGRICDKLFAEQKQHFTATTHV